MKSSDDVKVWTMGWDLAWRMNHDREKALKEGCPEIKQAQMDVSSIERTNTKVDLARAMTKSKSEMQTGTNGCVSQTGNELSY